MFANLDTGVQLFFDVDGSSLRPSGETMAEATPLVLLHGGPGFDHVAFKAFFPSLADRFQLVYYDHRGMGRSDYSSPDSWNLGTWADDLRAFLDHLGIENPILLGQSFGGFVAMKYAARHGDRLKGLILSSTAARSVPSDCVEAFDRLGGAEAAAVAQLFFDDPNPETFAPYKSLCMPLYNQKAQPEAVSGWTTLTPDVLFHFWRGEHQTFDLRADLRSVSTPTLVIAGDQDPITPPQRSIEIAESLPARNTTFRMNQGAGHGVYRDDFAGYMSEVNSFADSLGCTPAEAFGFSAEPSA